MSESSHIIIGGGLSGGLAALALADAGRGPGVVVVEEGDALGGNHTWRSMPSSTSGATSGRSFYASRTTALDRARLLLGRPPAGLSWRRVLAGARAAA